jgi:hypothetical protein
MTAGRLEAWRGRVLSDGLRLKPITFRQAKAFIKEHHRHHKPPQGHKFSIGVVQGDRLVGVVTVGRPVNRTLDDGWTAEVTRCCTDGTKNACSMLYGAAWRAAKAMGYIRIVTYTLITEEGTSLKAAGWTRTVHVRHVPWKNKSRPDRAEQQAIDKWRWEVLCQ